MSNGGFGPMMHPELLARLPELRPATLDKSQGLPGDIRSGDAQPAGAIVFDKIFRRSYTAPPTSGVSLALFTAPQDVTRGLITLLGVGSPQFDWFGTNEYYLTINNSPPMDQQFEIAGGPGQDGSFFGGTPIGLLGDPKLLHVTFRSGQSIALNIVPQTAPAAGTVVYNIWIRIGGFIFR